jgi:hypothetical protein
MDEKTNLSQVIKGSRQKTSAFLGLNSLNSECKTNE